MDAPALYFGQVMHRRLTPRAHVFRHGVFFLRCRIDRLDALRGPLFGINSPNLFSFYEADHGARDGTRLEPWIRRLLKHHGLSAADGEIWLQTFPRVLGYVFNPVSFWLCHDRQGQLRAVLAEVNNTFGEHHNYLLSHPDGRPIGPRDWLEARKVFHVSPFFDVQGGYRFRFADAGHAAAFRIDYTRDDGPALVTAIGGRRATWSTGTLLKAFLRYPWFTVGVMARIHYHALRLWAKRVPFFTKPQPPVQETTR